MMAPFVTEVREVSVRPQTDTLRPVSSITRDGIQNKFNEVQVQARLAPIPSPPIPPDIFLVRQANFGGRRPYLPNFSSCTFFLFAFFPTFVSTSSSFASSDKGGKVFCFFFGKGGSVNGTGVAGWLLHLQWRYTKRSGRDVTWN